MKVKAILRKAIWLFAVLFLALFVCFQRVMPVTAKADTTDTYTDVLTDLQKDESFNTLDYPANGKDYSLQVIQIAESADKELFVYVYQPSHLAKDLTATTIRMGLPTVGVDTTWKDYILTLVSTNGVFDKYKVEGLTVASSSVRYYDITAIYRAFDSTIDTPTGNDNTISAVAYEVAQFWTAQTVNGQVSYAYEEIDVVTITNKWCGHLRYTNYSNPFKKACDSWFVSFSTDLPIDDLIEADLSYQIRSVHYTYNGSIIQDIEDIEANGDLQNVYEYGQWNTIPVTLTSKDVVDYSYGVFDYVEAFPRIQSVDSFISMETLSDTTKSNLQNDEWVLRFTETVYDMEGAVSLGYYEEDYSQIQNVTILRLKFVTAGETYNLGVVDNFQSPDLGIDGGISVEKDRWEEFLKKLSTLFDSFWTKLLGILLLVVVIIAIITVLPWLVSLIGKGIGLIFKLIGKLFKGLWLLICLPFNLIGKGVRKIKGKRNKKNE